MTPSHAPWRCNCPPLGECRIRLRPIVIREDALLRKSEHKPTCANQEVVHFQMWIVFPQKLRHHLFVVKNWSRDEVWEERYEKRILYKILWAGLPLAQIYKICDLGKCKKRYSQRQNKLMPLMVHQVHRTQKAQNMKEVLVVAQHRKIRRNTQNQVARFLQSEFLPTR